MRFFREKLIRPILKFLSQGVSPSALAWAVTAGIVIALIPVFGATTLVCLAAIWIFKLNPGAALLVNQIAYPLQFVAYIPLIRSGEWIFRAPHIPLSVSQIFHLFKADLWNAIQTLWWSTMYALVAWTIFSIPVCVVLYVVFKNIFCRIASIQKQGAKIREQE